MKEKKNLVLCLLMLPLLFTIACNDTRTEKKVAEKQKQDTIETPAPIIETKKGPVINIGDTLSLKRMVLVMKDSAATMERVGIKLAEIYDTKLGGLIRKNNLKTAGSPMAWYKGEKAPFFFEAGIPVDKKPAKLPAGVYIKQMGVDSIVVAHFYGPYDLLPQAYDALKDWLKDHKKTPKGAPYEIYIGKATSTDGKPGDPYKVQTDVVWPWK